MTYLFGLFIYKALKYAAGDIAKSYLYKVLKKKLRWSPLARFIFTYIDKMDARKDRVIKKLQKKSFIGKIAAVILDCLDDIIDIFCP